MRLRRFTGSSITHTLPLLILCVQCGTVAALTLAVYDRVERILLRSAGERLKTASAPVALLFEQSTSRFKAQLRGVATQPAIEAYLRTGRDAPAARRALARAWEGELHPRGRVELRRADGTVVLDTAVGDPPRGSGWIERTLRSRPIGGDSVTLSPFTTFGDSTFSEAVAPVPPPPRPPEDSPIDRRAARERPVGYVADLRVLSAGGAATIRDLIGDHARLLLGSLQGGDWTDLEHPALGPPAGARADHTLVFASSVHGPAGVGAAMSIRGTPWVFWVEQPRSSVLAPMQSLLVEFAGLATVCVVVGAIAAWMFSYRITSPLVALTAAAERVSPAGLPADGAGAGAGGNEVVRLHEAFHRMSARVEESHRELESRVADRTGQLEEALANLEAAQAQLLQKERMAMLGQLASAVGHELRNPLGVMTNALYVLDYSLPDASPTVREYLGLLRGQIAISERIVGDLLDTARSRPPQIAPVPLAAHLETQLQRLGPLNGVEVAAQVPAELPCALVDPAQLAQILLNLLTNALQAMSENGGGILGISGYVDPQGRVCLAVTDTGPGMAPDVLARIFEPLFTTKAHGLGLGLWVSQTLARTNGAELTVTSAPGQGARFVLAMPAAPAQEAAAA